MVALNTPTNNVIFLTLLDFFTL